MKFEQTIFDSSFAGFRCLLIVGQTRFQPDQSSLSPCVEQNPIVNMAGIILKGFTLPVPTRYWSFVINHYSLGIGWPGETLEAYSGSAEFLVQLLQ
jgi:hypothetical protein